MGFRIVNYVYNRMPWYLRTLHLVQFLAHGAIMALMLMPIEFKSTSISYDYGNQINEGNNSPLKIDSIRDIAFAIPNPHSNVSNDELNRYWRVPPKTKLSPLTQRVGRCRLAVERKRQIVVDVDERTCDRVDSWPTMIMFVIDATFMFYYSIQAIRCAPKTVVSRSGWYKDGEIVRSSIRSLAKNGKIIRMAILMMMPQCCEAIPHTSVALNENTTISSIVVVVVACSLIILVLLCGCCHDDVHESPANTNIQVVLKSTVVPKSSAVPKPSVVPKSSDDGSRSNDSLYLNMNNMTNQMKTFSPVQRRCCCCSNNNNSNSRFSKKMKNR